MIDGLAGVLVYTTSTRWAAMATFYRDVLDLPVRTERDGFVSFAWGGQRLTVTVHSELDGAACDPMRIQINLSTDDIATTFAEIVARGAAVRRAPELERWGGWIATLADPDGNFVQLLQQPSK